VSKEHGRRSGGKAAGSSFSKGHRNSEADKKHKRRK
jgi:hypothetical protein